MTRAAVALLAALLLVSCGGDDDGRSSASASASGSASATEDATEIRTLVPVPAPPEEPPSGRLHADMRQSSIDVALGQMQVWLDNDRVDPLEPASVSYRDPRLPRPVAGERVRSIPADTELGYPLPLPSRPVCDSDAPAGSGVLVVTDPEGDTRVPVTDPTDVVGRYLAARCQELALAEVADVRWSDDAAGTLTLLVTPTGQRPASELVIDRVAGSHLLGYGDDPGSWEPALPVGGDDPPTEVELPLIPTRCDGHAFAEGGGATAFRLSFTIDGEPGQVLLRMRPAGSANALDWAAGECGLE